MALESLADHIYTTKSDVWSYGIVLWELVTSGASPYPGIAVQNLFHLLKQGYRMERPQNCSNELYQILRSCWQENPAHRPTFKTLVAKFEEMLSEGKDYLDLNPRIIENKSYFSEFLNEEIDEKESFLPVIQRNKTDEILKWKFEIPTGHKAIKSVVKVCKCPPGKCVCEITFRYENDNITETYKHKYENDIPENNSYVQPNEESKPVNSSEATTVCSPCEDVPPSSKLTNDFNSISNTNIYVENSKKEICEVKKI